MFPKALALIAAVAIDRGAVAATFVQSAMFTNSVTGSACGPCTTDQRVFTAFHLDQTIAFSAATFAVNSDDPALPIEVGAFAALDDTVGPDWFDTTTFTTVDPSASAPGTTLLRVAFTSISLDAGDYDIAFGAANRLFIPTSFRAGGGTHVIGIDGDTRWDNQVVGFRLDGASVAASVPEPVTWLILLASYGANGFVFRRRAGSARHVIS